MFLRPDRTIRIIFIVLSAIVSSSSIFTAEVHVIAVIKAVTVSLRQFDFILCDLILLITGACSSFS